MKKRLRRPKVATETAAPAVTETAAGETQWLNNWRINI
jgi:hypothetical protein